MIRVRDAMGGVNPFSYVFNNPFGLIDPYGLFGKRKEDGIHFDMDLFRNSCEDESACYEKAKKKILECQKIWNITKKFQCIEYWEYYQGQCPGKVPPPTCQCKKK
jgi:hypothetical protein